MSPIFEICYRLIYIFNLTIDDESQIIMNVLLYPTDYRELKAVVDFVINQIDFNKLPIHFKNIWMEDKFEYMTWIRDELIKNIGDTSF